MAIPSKKAIIFCAHPDDDVIGMGGTIAKMEQAGFIVWSIYFSSGSAGSLKKSEEEMTNTREKEADEAGKVLGVEKLIFWRERDGFITKNEKLLEKTTQVIRDFKPTIVFMPHKDDRHSDHRAVYAIVQEALMMAERKSFGKLGEPHKVPYALAFGISELPEEAQYLEDITPFINKKTDAIKKHESQLLRRDYLNGTLGLNKFLGVYSGLGEYVEAFKILRASNLLSGFLRK